MQSRTGGGAVERAGLENHYALSENEVGAIGNVDSGRSRSPHAINMKSRVLLGAASRRTDPDLPYGAGSDLARVIAAWSQLDEPLRRAVLAVIDSAAT